MVVLSVDYHGQTIEYIVMSQLVCEPIVKFFCNGERDAYVQKN